MMGSRQSIQRITGYVIAILIGIWFIFQPALNPHTSTQILFTPTLTTQKPSQPTDFKNQAALETASSPIPTKLEVSITPTLIPQPLHPESGLVCGFDPAIDNMMKAFPQEAWLNWIEILSGEKPVTIDGEAYTILTRFSESMFSGDQDARAYDFVISQLRDWGYEDDLTLFEQEFKPSIEQETSTWKNIIIVIPGTDPEISHEQVLLTAHLDSTAEDSPEERAPGADDNASGVATLLEAARVFRDYKFKRTIKIIFFTGEEQGLHGSRAYVNAYGAEMEIILGVINTDMFGYDGDNDRCFETHVGSLEESDLIGRCLADTATLYDLDLTYDYLIYDAIRASDHASFWDAGVGAIEVLENFSPHNYQGGCRNADKNPSYHSQLDIIDNMNIDTAHAIARAVIASVASLAEIVEN
jgi:leucyl aminopeptidase